MVDLPYGDEVVEFGPLLQLNTDSNFTLASRHRTIDWESEGGYENTLLRQVVCAYTNKKEYLELRVG